MEQLEYMEELDTISNMRNIIFKLPYKLREKWRSKACDVQVQRNTRVRMADLVTFIEKQATIVSDPAFGDIHDSQSISKIQSPRIKSQAPMKPISKGSFATYIDVKPTHATHADVRPIPQTLEQSIIPVTTDNVCIFCTGKHELINGMFSVSVSHTMRK